MRRILPLLLLALFVADRPALADPGIDVVYRDGLLRVTLDGSYAGTYYQILRSSQLVGEYAPMESQLTLCTGDCFLTDQRAMPGQTYYYEFVLYPSSGGVLRYGPYAVTVPDTPLAARVWPNPSSGPTRIELSVPGSARFDSAIPAEARLLDAQGRTVRVLYSGALSRGRTSVSWDGRGASGQPVGAGLYFVRVTTPLGATTTRVVRLR